MEYLGCDYWFYWGSYNATDNPMAVKISDNRVVMAGWIGGDELGIHDCSQRTDSI